MARIAMATATKSMKAKKCNLKMPHCLHSFDSYIYFIYIYLFINTSNRLNSPTDYLKLAKNYNNYLLSIQKIKLFDLKSL